MPKPRQNLEFERAMRDLTKGRRRQNDVIMWENRFANAEVVFDEFNKEVYRNIQFLRGQQLGVGDWGSEIAYDSISSFAKSGRIMIINKILTQLAGQNAAILWRRPWHYLKATRTAGLADEMSRWTAERALNACLGDKKNNWLLKSRLCLLMAEMGIGVVKATNVMQMTGKDPAKNRTDRYGEVLIMQDPQTGESITKFIGGVPRRDDEGMPIRKGKDKFLIDDRKLSDYYRTDFVHPFLMRFDPEGGNDSSDHAWIGELFTMTYDEFMAVPFFDYKEKAIEAARVLDKNMLSSKTRRFYNAGRGQYKGSFIPTKSDKDILRFYMSVGYDIVKREVVFMLDGFPKLIAKIKYPSYIEDHPYSISKLHEDPGEFIPITEVGQGRPMARAYNEMHSMLLTHAGRFTRRYLAREGMFRENEREKFKSNDDGSVIQYKRQYSAKDLEPVKDANLDPAIYRNMEIYLRDLQQLFGTSAFSQGGPEVSETATESQIVAAKAANRDTDKRSLLAATLCDHADKILHMMQDTLPEGILASAVGPDSVAFQKNLKRPMLAGSFESWIELGEMEPHDSRTERADLNEIVQLVGPVVLLSPTFSKKFFEARRMFDPQLVKEVQDLVRETLTAGASNSAEQGGPKPSKATEKTEHQAEGRSAGRQNRRTSKEAA